MCKKTVRKRYSFFLFVGAITVYLQLRLNYIRYNKENIFNKTCSFFNIIQEIINRAKKF